MKKETDILHIARKMHDLAKEKELTQDEIAQKMGYSRQTVNGWFTGKRQPSLSDFALLCDILDCDMDYITGRLKEKTHKAKKFCMETGLSESAYDTLKSFTGKKMILRNTVDAILRTSSDTSLINRIYDYLRFSLPYRNPDLVVTHHNGKMQLITDHDKVTFGSYDVSPDVIQQSIMRHIQNELDNTAAIIDKTQSFAVNGKTISRVDHIDRFKDEKENFIADNPRELRYYNSHDRNHSTREIKLYE